MQAIEEPAPLKPVDVDEDTAGNLNLNDKGEVEIPKEQVIGTASELFGDKVYGDIDDKLADAVEDITKNVEMTKDPKKDELKELQEKFSKPVANTLMDSARQQYGRDLKEIYAEPAGKENSGDNEYRSKP